MRIAILTNAFPPQSWGGAAKIAYNQALSFLDQGFEVCVWTPEPYPEHKAAVEIKTFKPQTSIKFAELGKHSQPSRLFFHLEDLGVNLDAVEQIRNWKPDILLTHNLTGCGWSSPKILQKTGVKWIHLLHDIQAYEPSGQMFFNEKDNLLKKLWRWFWVNRRKSSLGNPDAIVSPSNWLLSEHVKYGLILETKGKVIPNPLPVSSDYDEIVFDEHPTLIFVGRLEADKGFDLLLQAWESVKTSIPDSRLKVIGTGSMRSRLSKKDTRIEYLGALDHQEVMQQIKNSNSLVFTSRLQENYPTVLLEALSLRKNIVAHDVGGVGELLNGYGYLVEPGDMPKLKQAMVLSLQRSPDTERCNELIKKHDPDKIMQQWLKLLENL